MKDKKNKKNKKGKKDAKQHKEQRDKKVAKEETVADRKAREAREKQLTKENQKKRLEARLSCVADYCNQDGIHRPELHTSGPPLIASLKSCHRFSLHARPSLIRFQHTATLFAH